MKTYLKVVLFVLISAIILGFAVPTLVSAKSGIAFGLGIAILIAYFGVVLNFVIKKLTSV